MLCPTVQIDQVHELNLTEMEHRLVCGDDPKMGAQGAAWSQVPPSQARLQLKSFLQARGFNRPQFQIENGILNVVVGTPTVVTEIILHDAPPEIHIEQKRGVIGARLTPAVLNDLEQWLDQRLRFYGYGCPTLLSRANADTGLIEVDIHSGPQQLISAIDVNDELGLVHGTLRRYDAFRLNERFSERDVEITNSRILNLDVVQNNHFTVTCPEDGIHVHQVIHGGPPRTFSLGFGLNTETVATTQITWRHSRLDNHASIAEATAKADFRVQSLSSDIYWYFNSDVPRQYIKPIILVSHDTEPTAETNVFSIGTYFGTTADWSELSWMGEAGPVIEFDNTVVGPGPNASRNLLIKMQTQFQSHNFEYYSGNPKTGYRTALNVTLSDRTQFSQVSAQRFSLVSEHLYNYKSYDPALLILGLRFGLSTTITDLSLTDLTLPVPFRNYLGGSTDVRGYGRQELPLSGNGALTTGFSCFEARFASLLPAHLQPLVFYDVGFTSDLPMTFTLPILTAPGIGLRWDSPIGIFRGTLAHGYAYSGSAPTDPALSHWQGYLLYGEEF